MLVDAICLLEAIQSLLIYPQVLIAQSLIKVNFPVIAVESKAFIKDFYGSLVPP